MRISRIFRFISNYALLSDADLTNFKAGENFSSHIYVVLLWSGHIEGSVKSDAYRTSAIGFALTLANNRLGYTLHFVSQTSVLRLLQTGAHAAFTVL